MQKKFSLKGFLVFILSLGLLGISLSSCSTVASGIEHRNLNVQAKMSNTIFLNPVRPNQKTVFIQFKNTSQVEMPQLKDEIVSSLTTKGYTFIDDPYKAEFWLQGNVLYMGKQKKSMTMAGMLIGGYGGAVLGATTMGSNWGKLGTGSAGALVGSALGALAGSAIHVDTYIGVVDIQIKQKVNGNIKKQVSSNIQNGIGTQEKTEYKTTTQYQTYRTRIGVQATQTNMNLQKATPIIEHNLSKEIVGIFD